MGIESERKFLVHNDVWRTDAVSSHRIRQGFLSTDPERVVRIRVTDNSTGPAATGLVTTGPATTGLITIKGARSGMSRPEFEYPVPAAEAVEMLEQLCLPGVIDKVRHVCTPQGPAEYELTVDEFAGANHGLVLAEVEYRALPADPSDRGALPRWLGPEVTEDGRYANAALAVHPYREFAP
ncbi:CYTH domain-containing protein [Kitasatospora sp. NBC_01287]|uniref:CYTH domain-containing protein n=1 Tax=Kitasatospora sp. NBC_01287 TaxID=2903573 RepID=UPI002257278B|nr:CYTH domain-containing protein [Kitasatospora sp. NBC_01287]MCX4745123.1 CYTH domain-containing protein [Kitasatospora sp. NBC_01287]